MTHEEFARRIVAMQGTLYRVSCTLLPQLCDREDAVQSAIEKAWCKQATLKDESRLQAWMIRILINECHAIHRSRRREIPMDILPDTPAPPGADPDLYRFFTALPDKLRLPMVLFYLEGHEIKDIAAILHLPTGTIKSRLARGREMMRRNKAFEEVQDL
ncbi:MAG: RNA polymerase sigma factor [Clostridia bacterium]|nr:RNA polymerase sigma factor [Clostridia bacterium]